MAPYVMMRAVMPLGLVRVYLWTAWPSSVCPKDSFDTEFFEDEVEDCGQVGQVMRQAESAVARATRTASLMAIPNFLDEFILCSWLTLNPAQGRPAHRERTPARADTAGLSHTAHGSMHWNEAHPGRSFSRLSAWNLSLIEFRRRLRGWLKSRQRQISCMGLVSSGLNRCEIPACKNRLTDRDAGTILRAINGTGSRGPRSFTKRASLKQVRHSGAVSQSGAAGCQYRKPERLHWKS